MITQDLIEGVKDRFQKGKSYYHSAELNTAICFSVNPITFPGIEFTEIPYNYQDDFLKENKLYVYITGYNKFFVTQ
jgi:hypothetical protein